MKKIASICLLGAALASCSAPQNNGFEIKGTYADSVMDSKPLFLMEGDSILDSTVVAGKTFAFQGSVDTVKVYRIAGKAMMKGQVRYNTLTRVILDNGSKLNINVDQNVKVDDNGGDNSVWSQFISDYTDMNMEEMKQYQAMIDRQAPQDSMMLFVNGVRERLTNLWQEAVKANQDKVAGAAIFSDFCYEVDEVAFDSIYNSLKYASLFPALQTQKEMIAHRAATAEGKMFVDFGGKDLEGKDVLLSDFVGKGKYVLVDFWASWCGPCRAEIPNILKVNKKYAGKNFMVLGVDVWDQEDKFKTALEEEKVNYAQIFTGEDHQATTQYGINGIPHIVLFGPDGTILKRGLRGDAIEAAVKEYLKK